MSEDKKSVPLHRVAVVRPFVQFLEDVGTPVERMLSQAGLPYDALEFADNYLPSHGFWRFLVDAVFNEGINDLGFRVGQQFGVKVVDAKMSLLLQRSPTLFDGFQRSIKVVNQTVTHCKMGLLQLPDSDYAYLYHKPSCRADNPAVEQIGLYGLTWLCGIVRMFAGPSWTPKEIGVMTNYLPPPFVRQHFPDSRYRVAQPYYCISLENALLSLPPLPDKTQNHAVLGLGYTPVAETFTSSIQLVLRSYVLNSKISLGETAKICNMSSRTLQRKLADEGTSFNEILGHARFHVASKMLGDPSLKVAEVARQLRYSDAAHFSRAFRRVSGLTPSEYRLERTRT